MDGKARPEFQAGRSVTHVKVATILSTTHRPAEYSGGMELLRVDPRHQPLFQQLGLHCCGKVLARFGGARAFGSRGVVVEAGSLSGLGAAPLPVFFKLYRFDRPSWRFWLRASKAWREFDNYVLFERLGIPCVQRVACGEVRDWFGRLRAAFILTVAVPAAVTLEAHMLQLRRSPPEASRAERAALFRQLAAMTRRLHEAGFFHNDLYWRNVLVTHGPDGSPALWWIDCPRGGRLGWLAGRRRQIKDLAALDLSAAELCARTERLRFLEDYLSLDKLDARARQLAREILEYRRRRWPASRKADVA